MHICLASHRKGGGFAVIVYREAETLARDLKYLCGKGYRMVKGKAFDMFPMTGHVETVVALHRTDL